MLLRRALVIALTVAAASLSAPSVLAQPTACFPTDSSQVDARYDDAANTLPDPDRTNMLNDGRTITNDYASRGMASSGGYIYAMIQSANNYLFDWSCGQSQFLDWPNATSFSPATAAPGSTLVITGQVLNAVTSATLGGLPAEILSKSFYELDIRVPEAARDGDLLIQNGDLTPTGLQGFTALPGRPSNVSATAGNGSADVTWTPVAADSSKPIAQYTVTSSPGAFTAQVDGATSNAHLSGLTNGTAYSFTVVATNSAGAGPNSTPSAAVVPATIPGAPSSVRATAGNNQATVSWTTPTTGGSAITRYTVTSNTGQTSSGTASPITITGLANGTSYTFTVTASNAVGTSSPSAPSAPVTPQPPDTTAPSVTANATPVFSLGATASFSYSGSDAGSGLADYDVRYRRAAYNSGFGTLTYPAAWRNTTSRSVSIAAVKGATFCFSVRSRDRAGNVSPWSTERCTAVALDDRSLASSTGWARATASAYYAGTTTSIARTGATLTRTGLQTRRLALVVTTCKGCGYVGVYWNGKLVRTINLNAATTTQKRVITITDFGKAVSGTLVIKTLNAGRTYIDGLASSRS